MSDPVRTSSIDGRNRKHSDEFRLNEAFALTFSEGLGLKIYDYLKSITMSSVSPATVSDAELRHREGMRALFQIIDARRAAGIAKEPRYDQSDTAKPFGAGAVGRNRKRERHG